MNLNDLLKKIEEKSAAKDETKSYELVVNGETYNVRTLTRSEKRDMFYSRKIKNESTVGDVVKWAIPYIYKSLQLAQAAQAAKDEKYITRFHDIVEMIFEPDEIIDIIAFITDINNISQDSKEVVPDIKKP